MENKKTNGTGVRFDDYKDIISGGAMLLLAGGILLGANQIKIHKLSSMVNAAFMPRLVGGAMAVCALIVMVEGIFHLKKVQQAPPSDAPQEAEIPGVNKDEPKPMIATILLMIGYALLFEPLGFILSSALYAFGQIMVLTLPENRTKKQWIMAAVVAVVVSVLVYAAFRYGLDMLLPVGPLSVIGLG